MKINVFLLTLLFSLSLGFAQQTTPTKTGVVVKKSSTTTTDKSPAKQVAPSTQKKAVTPVNPNKTSVVPPKSTPATTTKDITGYWLTANKGSIIQFYKSGEAYYGRIVWQRQSKDRYGKPVTDVNNPDKSKRSNPLVGSQMVTNLKYNEKTKMYEGGKAYQPATGKSFNCKAKLIKNSDVLEVTAMAGMSLMSRTLTWTRTTGIPSK